jgi:hypothetical protein
MRLTIKLIVIAIASAPLAVLAQRRVGPPMQQERKILKQFDKDGNKRLDAEERKAARDWLASQPAGGFGFGRRGGPFGANAEPPAAGKKLTPADVKSYPGAPLYDPGALRTVFLHFEEGDCGESSCGIPIRAS